MLGQIRTTRDGQRPTSRGIGSSRRRIAESSATCPSAAISARCCLRWLHADSVFRPQVMNATLSKRDCFVLMPTGLSASCNRRAVDCITRARRWRQESVLPAAGDPARRHHCCVQSAHLAHHGAIIVHCCCNSIGLFNRIKWRSWRHSIFPPPRSTRRFARKTRSASGGKCSV